MADLPFMPLATGDLVADTEHMTAQEFGAYVRILCAMWRHGGRLPDDPARLARIAGVSLKVFRRIELIVLAPTTRGGGLVSQKRMTLTIGHVQEKRMKRALAARKRWAKTDANAYANGRD